MQNATPSPLHTPTHQFASTNPFSNTYCCHDTDLLLSSSWSIVIVFAPFTLPNLHSSYYSLSQSLLLQPFSSFPIILFQKLYHYYLLPITTPLLAPAIQPPSSPHPSQPIRLPPLAPHTSFSTPATLRCLLLILRPVIWNKPLAACVIVGYTIPSGVLP